MNSNILNLDWILYRLSSEQNKLERVIYWNKKKRFPTAIHIYESPSDHSLEVNVYGWPFMITNYCRYKIKNISYISIWIVKRVSTVCDVLLLVWKLCCYAYYFFSVCEKYPLYLHKYHYFRKSVCCLCYYYIVLCFCIHLIHRTWCHNMEGK